MRVWARTTSDYTGAFTRIRDAVAALPADAAVLDGEAILPRPDGSFDFEGLRSREGQASAILVAYDVLEVDGEDVRPEPLEGRRKRLARLLRAKSVKEGVQLSEALAGDGAAIFRHACAMGLEGIVSKRLEGRVLRLQPSPRPTAHVTRADAGGERLRKDKLYFGFSTSFSNTHNRRAGLAGVQFIPENGGGPGVRMKRRR